MGKGTIISADGRGLYTVRLDYGAAQKMQRIAALEVAIDAAEEQVTIHQAAVDEYEQRLTEITSGLSAAIDALAINNDEKKADALKKDVDRLIGEQSVVKQAHDQAAARTAGAKFEVEALRRKKVEMESLEAEKTVSAWCADYTESAAGDVATLEIPGEPANTVIAPACRPHQSADGAVVKRELMSPEQAFFNAAILPGWQKFRPTYRAGVAVSINRSANTMTVALDATPSSAYALGINRQDTMADVPIQYMTCGAYAFIVGDRVVVQFNGYDWSSPAVIGFESNPRPCTNWPDVTVFLNSRTEVVAGSTSDTYPVWYNSSHPCGPMIENRKSERSYNQDRIYFTSIASASTYYFSNNFESQDLLQYPVGWPLLESQSSRKTIRLAWDEGPGLLYEVEDTYQRITLDTTVTGYDSGCIPRVHSNPLGEILGPEKTGEMVLCSTSHEGLKNYLLGIGFPSEILLTEKESGATMRALPWFGDTTTAYPGAGLLMLYRAEVYFGT
ncbi:hypothetical protein [Thauera aromatica]|uniref:hypothetical protein n=1 Tax=Thauera aromatica TaxID=59405 RepID=UPI001FFD20AD|nr:hypothetical protein [Thauera aromatica]MCK2095621.1 hypothetical protein [Thauera aromatica]